MTRVVLAGEELVYQEPIIRILKPRNAEERIVSMKSDSEYGEVGVITLNGGQFYFIPVFYAEIDPSILNVLAYGGRRKRCRLITKDDFSLDEIGDLSPEENKTLRAVVDDPSKWGFLKNDSRIRFISLDEVLLYDESKRKGK